jgi:PAS domain S-box-containing protein
MVREKTATLAESEQRFRATFEQAAVGITHLSPEGKFLRVNQKLCDIVGYSKEELVTKTFQEITYAEDLEVGLENVRELIAREINTYTMDKRYIRKDGSLVWTNLTVSLVRDDKGQPQWFVSVIKDITERKRAEDELKRALEEVRELKDRFERENVILRTEIEVRHQHEEIIGESDVIRSVLNRAEQVAGTDTTVLITGETGTGKELLARAIHRLSSRKDLPMVTVNCAALPETLLESELFGREKGAYTGALTKQKGRFELADGSTIFLDEISELSPGLQAKLLRVIEEGTFERLGSPTTITTDVRVLAATNRNLEEMVREGGFREDLYYRIKVFPIHLPPLRDRTADIPLMVWSFVQKFTKKMGKQIESIPRRDMECLRSYRWPGNIRELRNVIEHAMIISKGLVLRIEIPQNVDPAASPGETLREIENVHIVNVLERTGWRIKGKGGAAEILGIKPATLYSRMKKLGITRPPK